MPLYLGNQKVVPAIYTATDIDFPVAVELGGTGATDAATARENLGITPANIGAQTKHTTSTASLTVSGWSSNSQTVSASGVTASNTVFVAPAPASQDAYGKAGVKCTAQASGTLTFTCSKTPEEALTVNIVVLGV